VSRPVLAAFCVGAAALLVPAQAQEPPKIKPFTLEVEVDVVSVTAVVFDKSGKPVRGLGTKDVQLTENGVKQDVSYFREASSLGDPSERVPLSVILVLDTSGSMAQNLRFLQEAVLNFVYKLE
jgi:VWFA-related protein